MTASSSGPQLWCSASRPTAVVVPLPGQLPAHSKPGVGLGDLQLSAPQVLLDVDVGPALLCIDLVVECLAMGQRLVTSLHGVVPGQLPPLRHGTPPSSGPLGRSRLERRCRREYAKRLCLAARPAGRADRLATTYSSAYDPAQVLWSGGGRLTRLVELAPPPDRHPPIRGRWRHLMPRR